MVYRNNFPTEHHQLLRILVHQIIYLVNSCSIPLVKDIPEKLTLIIGHGYGFHELSAKRELFNNDFIALIIQEILEEQNRKLIQ